MKRTIPLLLIGFVVLVVACIVTTVAPWRSQNRAKVSPTAVVSSTPLPPQVIPAEAGWLNDYKKAQEEAKAGNKLLLLNFTGSDWCGWCIRLDKDVFSQPNFKDYASKNLVLLELDFPWPGGSRAQTQAAEVKKQNEELASQYQVNGFPTLVVLDGNGQKLWQFEGYLPGPELIAQLEKLRKG